MKTRRAKFAWIAWMIHRCGLKRIIALVFMLSISITVWQQQHIKKYPEAYLPISIRSLEGRTSVNATEGYRYIMMWAGCYGIKDCGWGNPRYLETRSCPEYRCRFTSDRSLITAADVVIYHIRDIPNMIVGRFQLDVPDHRDPEQLWVAFTMESPDHTYLGKASTFAFRMAGMSYLDKVGFNATMGYMRQNDFHMPYSSFRCRNDPLPVDQVISAKDKSRMVLWLVSNCVPDSRRAYYTRILRTFINVDVYGWCGMPHPCPENNDTCFREHKSSYKFYLAFENSECRDYISEKFWDALAAGVVPVVMGAYLEDYKALSPPGSFIHVDNFASPRHLAEYLHYLDKNDFAYNRYLAWREQYEIGAPTAATRRLRPGTGIEYDPLCQMCAMAHNSSLWKRKSYRKISQWYSSTRLCNTI